jgi:hypothetical protein
MQELDGVPHPTLLHPAPPRTAPTKSMWNRKQQDYII